MTINIQLIIIYKNIRRKGNNSHKGPTFASGKIEDFTSENNPPTSSLVFLLRWSNVEGLDKYFAGDPNHEKRKASDTPLASLDLFLDMSKEEFIKLLEEQ